MTDKARTTGRGYDDRIARSPEAQQASSSARPTPADIHSSASPQSRKPGGRSGKATTGADTGRSNDAWPRSDPQCRSGLP
eukprot:8888980-Alexandrium_andersonii.AAC.1